MNRLVIIGNGFDMAHGLKTSYVDFINWYWKQRLFALLTNSKSISKDCLCEFTINNTQEYSSWFNFFYFHPVREPFGKWKYQPKEIIEWIRENTSDFSVNYSKFFSTIIQSIEEKSWVDIENDYYQLLKTCNNNPNCGFSIKELNDQLNFIQSKLIEYLNTIEIDKERKDLYDAMTDIFYPDDFSTEGREKAIANIGFDITNFNEAIDDNEKRNKLIPEKIMLLSFNYTRTARLYANSNIIHNYIHGEIDKPQNIIFGYGDELDKEYQSILDKNNNELLKNIKSVKYLETRNYREMLDFLHSAPFQVFLMGHSCGNSDRTLLNTLFEHDNCISIKPFYHKWDDGTDNYMDLVQNISRSFTNMKLFRDRVVNKEQCLTI